MHLRIRCAGITLRAHAQHVRPSADANRLRPNHARRGGIALVDALVADDSGNITWNASASTRHRAPPLPPPRSDAAFVGQVGSGMRHRRATRRVAAQAAATAAGPRHRRGPDLDQLIGKASADKPDTRPGRPGSSARTLSGRVLVGRKDPAARRDAIGPTNICCAGATGVALTGSRLARACPSAMRCHLDCRAARCRLSANALVENGLVRYARHPD